MVEKPGPPLKSLLISGLVFIASTGLSFAQAQKISSAGLDGLYTTTTVEKWAPIRKELFSAYGGEIKEISFVEMQDPNLKGANLVSYPGGEILILAGEETPLAILEILAEIFPDFSSEPINEYNTGFSITMQENGTEFSLEGTVFKDSKTSPTMGGSVSIQVGDGRQVSFPNGSKILMDSEQDQGGIKIQLRSLTVPQSKGATVSFVIDQLNDAGIKHDLIDEDEYGQFSFSANDDSQTQITVTTIDSDPNASAVSIMMMTDSN